MLAAESIDKQDFETAIKIINKALKIRLKAYGETHPRVADLYFNLGSVYLALGDVETAKKYFDKAMRIRVQLFGADHFAVGLCHMNLGRTAIIENQTTKGND
jgi:tetratricopeptide (TPR) repeat protein